MVYCMSGKPERSPEQIEIRRSKRRTRTVSATKQGNRTVVSIPANFSAAQEQEWVNKIVEKLFQQERKRRPSDEQLLRRAQELNRAYLGGKAEPSSVRGVKNQNRRWGSCTMPERSIRISEKLKGTPKWVLDYVLLHELSHILVLGHGPEFWALLETYPKTERARGFLEGYAFLISDEEPN